MLSDLRPQIEVKGRAEKLQRPLFRIDLKALLIFIQEVLALTIDIEPTDRGKILPVLRRKKEILPLLRRRTGEFRSLIALIELKLREAAKASVLQDILYLSGARVIGGLRLL